MGVAQIKAVSKFGLSIALIAAFIFACCVTSASAQDEWEEVGKSVSYSNAGSASHLNEPPSAPPAEVFYACGEMARAPAPKIAAMVRRIDELWGAHVRVYQSVAPESPHAMPGGCIFYNKRELETLLARRLDLNNPKEVKPMLWAIFAHEVGHEYHRDFSHARAHTPSEIKELEADRFAGYTLEKLNIPASGLAPYWSMAGDEFGSGPKHGSSAQRVAAFKEGWRLAEWDRPEDSKSVLSALNEPVAPDNWNSAQ